MKTIAIRLDDELHARLAVVAQLDGKNVTDEIREAIEQHIERKRSETDLTDRAQSVLADIERDATARRQAIQALFGADAPEATPAKGRGGRKGSQPEEPAS